MILMVFAKLSMGSLPRIFLPGSLGASQFLSRRQCNLSKLNIIRNLYVSTNLCCKRKSKLSYFHATSSIPLLDKTIGDVLIESAEKHPDKEFVVFSSGDVRKTFRNFKNEVHRLSRGLIHLGVRRGDRVAIWGPNSLEWLHTQYAVASIGAILVNINPACRHAELEHALSTAGVKMLLSASTFKTQDYYDIIATICPHITSAKPGNLQSQRLPDLESIVLYGGESRPGTSSLDDVMSMGNDEDAKIMDACMKSVQFDDPSNIIFTSGTTGLPKGATLTNHLSVNNSHFLGNRMELENSNHVACAPPPFTHIFGTNIISLNCMLHGVKMVVPAPSFEPGPTIKAIHHEKCTLVFGTPTMFISILHDESLKDYDVSSVQTIFCGGTSIPPETMKLAQSIMGLDEVVSAYGLTEVGGISTVVCKQDTLERRLNTVGKVQDHLEVKVIDPSTKETVTMGTAGELCFRGWCVMKEYWGNPDRTRETIDENRWFHTGDVGTIDDQGYFKIESRLKDLIIRGGSNIYPAEVEHLIHTHPCVQEVQVIGIPDDVMGEEVCAVVMLKPGTENSVEEDIREFCKGKISHYKIPRYVRFVNEFPTTVSGKIQKFKLREHIQDLLDTKRL
ncbi:medium-chain acyl-CoA ligase ACSF2, mitochondrial-like isoform X2 [Lytechinus pictus]